MTRLRPVPLMVAGFLGASLVAGILVNQQWLYIAFIGLMVFMHLFGHGSHGSSHDEHSNHGGEAS